MFISKKCDFVSKITITVAWVWVFVRFWVTDHSTKILTKKKSIQEKGLPIEGNLILATIFIFYVINRKGK